MTPKILLIREQHKYLVDVEIDSRIMSYVIWAEDEAGVAAQIETLFKDYKPLKAQIQSNHIPLDMIGK